MFYLRRPVLVRNQGIVLGLFILSLGATGWLYLQVPGAFLPQEDQCYFITIIRAPEGVSLTYTSNVMRQVEEEILKFPQVAGTFILSICCLTPGKFRTFDCWGLKAIILTCLPKRPIVLREDSS